MTARTDYPIRWHDHPPAVVALDEYHEARHVLARLRESMWPAGAGLTVDEWIAMAGDFASTNAYADMCGRCVDAEQRELQRHDDDMDEPCESGEVAIGEQGDAPTASRVRNGAHFVTPPYRTAPDDEGALRADYQCPDGHRWSCRWSIDPPSPLGLEA